MSNGHYQYACKHGQIVMLCKCIGPHEVRRVECPPSCPPDYRSKHASSLGVQILGCYPKPHTMVQTSMGSRVFACACGHVNVRPMIGDPSPGRHRKVNA